MVCMRVKAGARILACGCGTKYIFHTSSFLVLKVVLFKMPFEILYVKISALLSLIQAVGNHSLRCYGTFIFGYI